MEIPGWIKESFEFAEPKAKESLVNRLSLYPVLRPEREILVSRAINRTRDLRFHLVLCEDENYFKSKRQFLLWHREVSYRETLRQAMLVERVMNCSRRLDPTYRRLLYWSYLDQLSVEEIARALEKHSEPQKTPDVENVAEGVRQSHTALEKELRNMQTANPLDRIVFASLFPAPANVQLYLKIKRIGNHG